MRLSLLTVLILTSSISSAQFIPQPAGYNPDENADGIIGVSDLAGILSLYGSAFNSEDSVVFVSETFSAINFYDTFCSSQVGGNYDCETRACDNYPIAPLVLPEADVYQIHVPHIVDDDAPWWPDGITNYGSGGFVATLPSQIGFKAIMVYFTVESMQFPGRNVRLYANSDFTQIDFSICSAFTNSDFAGRNLMEGPFDHLPSKFYIFLHTPDGVWRQLRNN